MIRWFSPHPMKSCWFLMQYSGKGKLDANLKSFNSAADITTATSFNSRSEWQVVIAITLTPVRYKRHMQFLTSAPNFRGGDPADPVTLPSRAPDIRFLEVTGSEANLHISTCTFLFFITPHQWCRPQDRSHVLHYAEHLQWVCEFPRGFPCVWVWVFCIRWGFPHFSVCVRKVCGLKSDSHVSALSFANPSLIYRYSIEAAFNFTNQIK